MRSRNRLWSAKIDSGVDLDLSGHLWGHRPAIWVVGLEISRRGDRELTLTRRHIIFLGHFSCYFGQNRREWPEPLIHILVFFAEIGPKNRLRVPETQKISKPYFHRGFLACSTLLFGFPVFSSSTYVLQSVMAG
jgi:hypothetical protein